MVEEKGPDRAERRRQKKEGKSECTQCEHGPCEIAPRVFTKCPVCGCPARFVVEAIKGDLHLEDILGKEPALFGFEYHYDTPNCKVKLMAVGASCARCGVFYTIARDKMKGFPGAVPPGGDHHGLFLPRGG